MNYSMSDVEVKERFHKVASQLVIRNTSFFSKLKVVRKSVVELSRSNHNFNVRRPWRFR